MGQTFNALEIMKMKSLSYSHIILVVVSLTLPMLASSDDVKLDGNGLSSYLKSSRDDHLAILRSIKKRDKDLKTLSLKVKKLEDAVYGTDKSNGNDTVYLINRHETVKIK